MWQSVARRKPRLAQLAAKALALLWCMVALPHIAVGMGSGAAQELAQAHTGAVSSARWPGRPDRPDSDAPLLPVRSGDIINLRSLRLDHFCNVRDVGAADAGLDRDATLEDPVGTDGSSGSSGREGALLRSVLSCSEADPDGPGGSLLLLGANFVTDEIREGDVFYIKSQRNNKFCALQALLEEGEALQGGEAEEGEELDHAAGNRGSDAVERRRRPTSPPLVVACTKMHYDASSEWRAASDPEDARVIFLQPASLPPGASGASDASGLGCAPRGPAGVLVCGGDVEPRGRSAALEVVVGGYRPGGDTGGGDYPSGDYPDGSGEGDYPYYPGASGRSGGGGHPYYPGGSDYPDARSGGEGGDPYYPGRSGSDPYYPGDRGGRGEGGNPYYPGGSASGGGFLGGGEGSYGLDVKKKGKLPFRTGSTVVLTSSYLETACDTAADPAPYGPYGPGGDKSHDGGYRQPRRMLSAASARASGGQAYDDSLSRHGKGGSSPGGSYYPYDTYDDGGYDGGGDGDALSSAVWCNASIPDGPPQHYPPYPSGSGSPAAAAKAPLPAASSWWTSLRAAVAELAALALAGVGRLGGSGVAGTTGRSAAVMSEPARLESQWDLDGFVLMGTDFQTPDIVSGGRVYLKNQNTRKFCRVASAADANGLGSRLHGGELVCDRTRSGPDTEFIIELLPGRAGGGERGDGGHHGHGDRGGWWPDQLARQGDQGIDSKRGGGHWPSGGGDWPSGGGDRPDGGGDDSGGYWPGGGGDKQPVDVRLRAPMSDMRYCAPEPTRRGAPIVCDLRHPDRDNRRTAALSIFRLLDATPGNPSGPPYAADSVADAE